MEAQLEVPSSTTTSLTTSTRNMSSATDIVSSNRSDTPPVSREKYMDVTSDYSKPSDESTVRLRKAVSVDSGGEPDEAKKPNSAFARGSFKRRSIRRRSSKRIERPEVTYGNNAADYEAIRDRVLEERAVVNAIEALQERWRMLTFMYDDCVEMNEGRKERRQTKLFIQRQFELIVIITLFLLTCLPMSVVMVFFCRLR